MTSFFILLFFFGGLARREVNGKGTVGSRGESVDLWCTFVNCSDVVAVCTCSITRGELGERVFDEFIFEELSVRPLRSSAPRAVVVGEMGE